MQTLHTMFRVGSRNKSLGFYTGVPGMRVIRRHEAPDGYRIALSELRGG